MKHFYRFTFSIAHFISTHTNFTYSSGVGSRLPNVETSMDLSTRGPRRTNQFSINLKTNVNRCRSPNEQTNADLSNYAQVTSQSPNVMKNNDIQSMGSDQCSSEEEQINENCSRPTNVQSNADFSTDAQRTGQSLIAMESDHCSSEEELDSGSENNDWESDTEDDEEIEVLSANNSVLVWSTNHPNTEHIDYTAKQGIKSLPKGDKPIDYFNLLVTDKLLDIFVEETNAHAVNIFFTSSENARISKWVDTDRLEMKKFLSLVFHMGTIKMNRIEDYWKTSRLFSIPFFRETMGRNRFTLLFRALHFSREIKEEDHISDDKLQKIQPVLSYFNSRMREVYEPSKNLCIHESMAVWQGRLIPRQCMKNKRLKYVRKMYMLTEPWNLIHRIIMYSGQDKKDIPKNVYYTESIVENLMEGLFDRGRSLFMDDFYNSVQLSQKLLKKKTYLTGILRSNQKDNPKDVIIKKLKRGEHICRYTKEGISIVKWKDKHDVTMISSEFPHFMCKVNIKKEVMKKPIALQKYHEITSLIDRHDQISRYYPFERKSLSWYKHAGFYILNLLLTNSYTLYNKYVKKVPLYEFRLSVIQSLLPNDQNITGNPQKAIIPCNTHFPKKVNKNVKKRYLYKRCKICYDKGIHKVTMFFCPLCKNKPGLCLDNCFEEFHKEK